ncbi:MAG: hypothetical protein LBH00_09205 [Planctomycetaceae bacterium]|jgi:hypothetical protein|nr:hypothetical protein [Planctomycetaceae bacterium]
MRKDKRTAVIIDDASFFVNARNFSITAKNKEKRLLPPAAIALDALPEKS